MNSARLLNILDDIVKDDTQDKYQTKLQELRDSLANGQSDTVELKRKEILAESDTALSFGITKGNKKLLEEVRGYRFSVEGLLITLDEIFANGGYKTLNRLDEYIKERKEFIDLARNTVSNLLRLNIESHAYFTEYEVSFSLPKAYGSVGDLPPALKVFDEFLRAISEVTGEPLENKLSVIDDGCWEFLVIKGTAAAKGVEIVLNKFVEFYAKIQQIQEAHQKIKFLKNKNIEQELKNDRSKLANDLLTETVAELMKSNRQADSGRKNELPKFLELSLKRMFLLMEKGAALEVVMPYLVEADAADTNSPNQPTKKERAAMEILNKSLIETNAKLKNLSVDDTVHLLSEAWPSDSRAISPAVDASADQQPKKAE